MAWLRNTSRVVLRSRGHNKVGDGRRSGSSCCEVRGTWGGWGRGLRGAGLGRKKGVGGLGGLDQLVEGLSVDDVVVDECGLDHALGDMEVAGGGVDVVLGWVLVGDVCAQVIERAQELLRESSLKLLTTGFGGGKGAEGVISGPDDVAKTAAELEATAVGPAGPQCESVDVAGRVA